MSTPRKKRPPARPPTANPPVASRAGEASGAPPRAVGDEAAPANVTQESPREAFAWGVGTIVLVAITFAHTLAGDWLWDDEALVLAPRLMRGVDGLSRIWRGEGTLDYFPLTSTSFWIERQLFDRTLGYRIDNLVLHAANAFLVGSLALRVRVPNGRAVGLLFAIHPMIVSSVTWVSERKNTLSMLLGLLALLCALPRERTWPTARALAGSVALFALALLAKTQLVGLPIVLAALLALRGRPPREVWVALGTMLGVSVALGLVTVSFQDAARPWDAGGPVERVLRAGDAVRFYLTHTVWPSPLAMVHARDAVSGSSPGAWIATIALLAGLAALVWAARERPWARPVLAGVVAYLALLAPVLGLLDMSFMRFSFVAEHFAYVALPVPLAGLVVLASRLGRPGALALVGLAALLSVWASHGYARVFTSRMHLWAHNAEVVPTAATAHGNLALALSERGRPDEAIEAARRAVRLSPDDAELHCFLGVVLMQRLQLREARTELEIALALDPELVRAHNNLASVLVHEGDVEGGVMHLREAVRLEPHYALGHMNLARLLRSQGRVEEAEAEREEAIALDPELADVPLAPEAPAS